MEPTFFCPLGSQCEEIKDNKLFRCVWNVKLVGKNPQDNSDIDQWGCAVAWMPILAVEISRGVRGNIDATTSLRDETIQRQDVFNTVLTVAMKNQQKKEFIEG